MRRFIPLAGCFSVLFLGLLVAGVASAAPATQAPTSTPTLSPTVTATPTGSDESTPTPVVTATVVPTSTPVVTVTVVPTSTKFLTHTHPVALAIAAFFHVPVSETLALRSVPGMGFGNIARVYFLAEATGQSVSDIVALRQSGLGWGQVAAELSLSPASRGRNLGLIMRSRGEQPPADDSTETVQESETLAQSSKRSETPGQPKHGLEIPPGRTTDGSAGSRPEMPKAPQTPPSPAKQPTWTPPGRAKQGSGTVPSHANQRNDHGAKNNGDAKGSRGKP
ncbi:MAG: hypothetical protein M5U01_07225 [Ardenticatenaceae bacterium]|nr:hypothetical protein [Ardenticatenaceae bacterium]